MRELLLRALMFISWPDTISIVLTPVYLVKGDDRRELDGTALRHQCYHNKVLFAVAIVDVRVMIER